MDKKPFIVACICKNEKRYIGDFVKYHLNIGFDKIIIGDNNDVDGEQYDEQLKEFTDNGTCEIRDLRGQIGQQKQFYNSIIIENDFEWCAFIDCDEYITFAENSKFKNIKDFLNSNPNAYAYKLNWMCYGDNGYTRFEDKPVVERFTKPMPLDFTFHYTFPENSHIKTILRGGTQARFVVTPHNVTHVTYKSPNGDFCNSTPFNRNMDFSIVYIRHFYTKSLEEWVDKKMKNKFADIGPMDGIVYYPIKDYFIYNELTPEKEAFLKERGIQYEAEKE